MDLEGFHFDTMGTTEEQERYCSGGFHPIAIGVMLDPEAGLAPPERRYRILHKLGFGSYATVWLARDVRASTFVAVKVTTADSGAAEGREAKMLEKFAGAQGDTIPTHVLQLHDHFTITGPNGVHHVLVTDVVLPVLSVGIRSMPPDWRKAAARGLVLGVAQMHRHGVKHGDLHLGNLGCAMPELVNQEEDDVVQDLSPYEMTVVLPRDPRAQTASLPPYVVMPCNLATYWARIRSSGSPPDVKILDFGNAREMHERAGELQCAVEACAPEIAFARVALKEVSPEWGAPSDVWAVSSTIYEIVAGSSLFYGMGIADGLLNTMVKLTGAVPPAWQSYWQSRPYLQGTEVSSYAVAEEWERRRASLRAGCADEADAELLVQLLRRMLVLDPEERPTINEVLEDPWFQDAK
ncbi:kinase-like protein [Trametes versicolor FP-101664 SS1]|uniref:kinase-like protein n=1 Tax=Trametes versicolor (strain FP-101664) TaxID=717944 RepID=UPI000462194F|nr:kinase-like protein [Trametes versicolor FP-101664 SS1]EIW59837.1 kinase-like protein [Trametes versicolor FP-101664 SS1]